MTPDGKTFDPETVTDKQLVQYEQAIDRGLTEADAMRLTEHEYNGFQANAIIAAALNPAVGEDAKIAIRGGDFARFLDPQMDARRMEAAYLVVAHGGSDLPVEHLSRSQLLTINNILLQGHIPYETVRAIAKPAFTPESMEVITAAMENARHDPYTGEHSLTAYHEPGIQTGAANRASYRHARADPGCRPERCGLCGAVPGFPFRRADERLCLCREPVRV